MKNKVPFMISMVAIILSIIAIVIVIAEYHPRTNLSFDYLGLIVGILTLLVTILLGWQIVDKIGMEKKMQDMIVVASKSIADSLGDENTKSMLMIYMQIARSFSVAKDWAKMSIILRAMIDPLITFNDASVVNTMITLTEKMSDNITGFTSVDRKYFIEYLEEYKKLSKVAIEVIDSYQKIHSRVY